MWKAIKENKAVKKLFPIFLFILTVGKKATILLKISKFATLYSMLITLGLYAAIYGWMFAVAIIYLIFIHEMGHLWAAKRVGIKTSKAIFIPFLGAAIGLKEQPKDANQEAFLAYMGPVFGTLAFMPFILLYLLTNNPFFALVVLLGAMLNLFNLLPVHPMDGGRIFMAISSKFLILGFIVLLLFAIVSPDPIIFLIVIMCGFSTWDSLFKKKQALRTLREIRLLKQAVRAYNNLDPEDTNELKMTFEELNEGIRKSQEEYSRLKSYLNLPRKLSLKWLALYLLLAIALSIAAYFGLTWLPDPKSVI